MRPARLLARVDRLPTIHEMPESPRDSHENADDFLTHAMDEYVDSIEELSRPASFPRHGPLGGHMRWKTRVSTCGHRRCHANSPPATNRPVIYDSGTPVVPGDASLAAVAGARSTCETPPGLSNDPLACLFAQPHGHRAGLGGKPPMEMPG
ncbi:unnamed protein product [Lota lota]